MKYFDNPEVQKIRFALKSVNEFFSFNNFPIKQDDLKKAYREASLRLHPDRNSGSKESEEKFKEMQATYDLLYELQEIHGGIILNGDKNYSDPFCTVDGTPLVLLGKGLGPTTNGRDCEGCNHKGYRAIYQEGLIPCMVCDENGKVPQEYPCRNCKGTGIYTYPSGAEEVCYKCKGTKKFVHPTHKKTCAICYGSKIHYGEIEHGKRFVTCGNCGGSGEIEILNPLMLKGALFITDKRLHKNDHLKTKWSGMSQENHQRK